MLDDQLDRCRQFHVQRDALVGGHGRGLVLQQVVRAVADGVLRDGELVVGVRVHEHELLAVLVGELHAALVDVGGLHLQARVESLVDDLPGEHVLQLGAHEGGALAGLDMLELDHGPELAAVELEHEAVLEVVRGGHGCGIS